MKRKRQQMFKQKYNEYFSNNKLAHMLFSRAKGVLTFVCYFIHRNRQNAINCVSDQPSGMEKYVGDFVFQDV